MDYNEILLQAIDTVIESKLKNLQIDKTVIGTVIGFENEKAKISSGTETFLVDNDNYKKDDRLYILNTSDGMHIVLNKYMDETNIQSTGINNTYIEKIVLTTQEGKKTQSSYLWDVICLEGDFKCIASPENNYGISAEIVLTSGDTINIDLDSADMLGNPFGFIRPTKQKTYISLDNSFFQKEIKYVNLSIYNNITEATIPLEVSNIKLSLGYYKEKYSNDHIEIDAIGGAGYLKDKDEKVLRARWYNPSEYTELRWYYGEDEIDVGKEQITFITSHAKTEQEITAKVLRKGLTAKAVLQNNEKFKYDINLDTSQEVKNPDDCYLEITFSDVQSSTENEKIFVFQEKEYKVSAPITWNTNKDENKDEELDPGAEKDIKLFHFRKIKEDEYQANIESLTSPLGTDSIILKNEQVISNAASILGWSIRIKNKPSTKDENDKVIQSFYALDTYSGYYDYDNKLIDDHQRWLQRYVILDPTGKDLPEDWYVGSTITWMMPQPKNSMLYPGGFSGMGTDSEIAYKVTYKINNKEDYNLASQLSYRIKEVYNPALNDNTIICDITLREDLGGKTIRATHSIGFENGKASGTYTLAVYPVRRMCSFTSEKSKTWNFRVELFDKNGNIITDNVEDFTWVLKSNNEKLTSEFNPVTGKEIGIKAAIPPNAYNILEVTVKPEICSWNGNTPIMTTYPMTFCNANKLIHASVPINITYNGAGLLEKQFGPINAYLSNSKNKACYWVLCGCGKNGSISLSGSNSGWKNEWKGYTNCYVAKATLDDNIYIDVPQDFAYPENYQPYIMLYWSGLNDNAGGIVWSSPIITRQNRYGSEILNNWDGKTKIDDRYILSAAAAFGSKDSENKYSGVILGKVGNIINGQSQIETGLLGYREGIQTFGFNTDGTAFIGKPGSGRIQFDGNQGIIASANWFDSTTGALNTGNNIQGVKIDLKNGYLYANTSNSNYIRFDNNGLKIKVNDADFVFGDNQTVSAKITASADEIKTEVGQMANYYGYTNSGYGTYEKVMTINNFPEKPQKGLTISIKFTYGNIRTGSVSFKIKKTNGSEITIQVEDNKYLTCEANEILDFIYNGEKFELTSLPGSRITQTEDRITSEVRQGASYYGLCDSADTYNYEGKPKYKRILLNDTDVAKLQAYTKLSNGMTISVSFKYAQKKEYGLQGFMLLNHDGSKWALGGADSEEQRDNSSIQLDNPNNEIAWEAGDTLIFVYSNNKFHLTTLSSSKIVQTAESITSIVTTTIPGLESQIKQLPHTISLSVSQGSDTSASITLSVKDQAGNELTNSNNNGGTITIKGFVTFESLSGNGTTKINGANIQTGTINADRIIADTLTVNKIKGGTNTEAVTFTNITATGKITATSGQIGGWQVINNNLLGSAQPLGGKWYGVALDTTPAVLLNPASRPFAIGQFGKDNVTYESAAAAIQASWDNAAFRICSNGDFYSDGNATFNNCLRINAEGLSINTKEYGYIDMIYNSSDTGPVVLTKSFSVGMGGTLVPALSSNYGLQINNGGIILRMAGYNYRLVFKGEYLAGSIIQ